MPRIIAAGFALLVATASAQAAGDQRHLVEMPPAMQEHMLANMRDHLVAFEEILAALAAGDVDRAGAVAEQRIGMSSLSRHGASHMAPFMPEGMRAAGTELHRAASRFALAAENADVAPAADGQRAVFAALAEIAAQCNACHTAYRIR